MSTKTKKKVRLNVIDVLIIILAIALIATVVYRIYTGVSDKTSPSQSKYIMTFECEDEYSSLVEYLDSGKAVYFASNGTLLGNMCVFSGNADSAYVVDVDPTSDSFSYEKAHIRGYMKMSGEAIKSASGSYYSIGDVNVTVGSRIEVYTNEAVFTLVVKSIDPK
jgi:hypothetical protein